MSPISDQPGNEPDQAVERQLSAPEFVAELSTLISEVESATEGSGSLDVRIHYGFRILGGLGEDIATLLIKEGISWPTVQETLHETVPPYSTSLDASLQGEEIVFSIRSAKSRRWGAMQRTASGGEELAWAATEPLARRLAALKCRHAELTKQLELEEVEEDQIAGPTKDVETGAPLSDNSTLDESAERDDKGLLSGHQSDKDEQPQEVARLPDSTEQPMEDDPGQSSHEFAERAARDDTDNSNREEKDWEILF